MKPRLLLIFLILAVSCQTQTSQWQTLDFETFRIKTPPGWVKFKVKGIDSYVGGLSKGKDSLWFDYGWYSPAIDDRNTATHLYGQDTINGLVAMLKIPRTDGHGTIMLSIPRMMEENQFFMGGQDIVGTDTILKIFKSLIFKESDTTKNSILSYDKFKQFPFGSGRTLYYSYCRACHDEYDANSTAPALEAIFKERSGDWVFKFLTDRKALSVDSLSRKRMIEFAPTICVQVPDLTKHDVDQIISYINGI